MKEREVPLEVAVSERLDVAVSERRDTLLAVALLCCPVALSERAKLSTCVCSCERGKMCDNRGNSQRHCHK